MRLILANVTVCLALLFSSLSYAEEQKPLIIGLHPNVSTVTVLTLYQPVREYLAQALGRPVELHTAPDFRTYINHTLDGEFDIAITAPHLARLAQLKMGYVPLLHYSKDLRGYVIVKKDSTIASVKELRNQSVAVPDRLTIITMMGLEFLKRSGLQPGRDIRILSAHSHNNAAMSVDKGESTAAIIGSVPFQQLSPELRGRLRIIAETESIPSQFVMAHKRLGSAQLAKIKSVLIAYGNTEQGHKFLQDNGFGGFQEPTAAMMRRLDVYAKDVQRLLSEP